MLSDRESFAILLADNDTDILRIVQTLSLRKQIRFNRCKLNGDADYSYILYTEPIDQSDIFYQAKNKKLKLIWKSKDDFYIIDFKNNTKGDIVCYLSKEDVEAGKLEGDVITPNLKPQFQDIKKVQLVSSKQLDEENSQEYEYFCFYIKNTN